MRVVSLCSAVWCRVRVTVPAADTSVVVAATDYCNSVAVHKYP
ncbi:MAG: hypothetical protein NTW87_27775 [Planctomycetota bacterium]|nr:hypothetical protein [Planctomycetota bacterium]